MSEKIQQLQMIEQNVQQLVQQKQQLQTEKLEINSALEGLKTSQESYKIIGNIMVKSNKEELKKELDSKIEIITLKLTSLENQEQKLKEKAKSLRDEVVKEMGD